MIKYMKNKKNEIHIFLDEMDIPKEFVELTEQELQEYLKPKYDVDKKITSISRAQGKAMLIKEGKWDDVLNYLDSIEDKTERAIMDISMNDATHWDRDSLFIKNIAETIGLSDSDLDTFFNNAHSLTL